MTDLSSYRLMWIMTLFDLPVGTNGRRADDLSLDVPVAAGPDMNQSQIDELFKPRKVAL